MGGAAKTVKNVVKHPARALAAGATGGLSEAFQQNPFSVPLPFRNPLNVGLNAALHIKDDSSGIPGPFSLDPNQLAGDQAAIKALGEKQYQETIDTAPKVVQDTLSQVLPGIAEDYNAGHVLNSTAYPQEVARQASNLTQNLVLPAIQARQGFQTGALQRGMSLEDFVNQANVAKTIGAQLAPQVGNGKGTAVSGLGSGAAAGSAFGPWGSLIGGGLGYLGGGGLGGGGGNRGGK